jgi:hypothetical protein
MKMLYGVRWTGFIIRIVTIKVKSMNTSTKVIITCISFQVIAIGATVYVYNPQCSCKIVSYPVDAVKKIGVQLITKRKNNYG